MTVAALSANEARVRLQAPEGSYVYFAHMLSPSASTRFNDNYIDLQPGEARELEVCDP